MTPLTAPAYGGPHDGAYLMIPPDGTANNRDIVSCFLSTRNLIKNRYALYLWHHDNRLFTFIKVVKVRNQHHLVDILTKTAREILQ